MMEAAADRYKPTPIPIPICGSPDLSNGDSDLGTSCTPPTPTITFSVCDDDDDVLEHPDMLYDGLKEGVASGSKASTEKRGSIFGIPSFNQLRRMSDTSMRQVKERLRRMSTTGTTILRCANSHIMSRPQPRASGSPRPVAQRKMSVDFGGILKQSPSKSEEEVEHRLGFFSLRMGRKSVSFCTRDNVRVYERWDDEAVGDAEDEQDAEADEGSDVKTNDTNDDDDGSRGRSLVPTFVFPGKRPTYAKDFDRNVLILESVDITDDLCIMGNVRVNMTRLRGLQAAVKNYRSTGRVSVGATYSTDNWKTSRDTRAMVINAESHPALSGKDTRAMRFYIDCDELEVGDTIELWLWCCDKFYPIVATSRSRAGHGRGHRGRFVDTSCPPLVKKYKDDNDGLFYKVSCTPKLNVWAAKAAQELKNFTPIIRFNQSYV